jgi:hypothetical protein
LSLLVPGLAFATPRALPFTYTSETLSQGELEVEQYADVMPAKAWSTSTGAATWYAGTQFQTELEYGLADRLELGLYFVLAPSPGDALTSTAALTENTGLKQRVRYQFAEPGTWPVDVGLYGEVVENTHELELEFKVLLQRRVGALRLVVNLWAEYEFYFNGQRDFVVNPTAGATYEFSRLFHLGVEGWLRAEWPDPAPAVRPWSAGPAGYVGLAALFNFGKLWWSTGLYARVTGADHVLQPGEPWGPFWARTVVGVEL